MAIKLFEWIKAVFVVLVFFFIFQTTGLLSGISFVAQSAVLQTGLLDADATVETATPEDFDFNFTIKDLDGNKIPFEQYRGKVIFLNLWATWCGPCRSEMPTIQKLFNDVPKDKIAFVMLSIDRDSDKEKIVKYISKMSFTFPVFQPSGYLPQQLNVPSIPTTFIISKDGKIVATVVGTTNFNTTKFKKFIKDLAEQ